MTDLGKILIADDEDTFLHSTADLLRCEGYQCTCVADASEAVEILRTREYDLLIADIKMPGNPNLELIQELEQSARGMPAILMTGYPSIDSAIQSVQLPVMAYLVKPIDFNELLKEVRIAIEHYRTYRAVCNTHQHLREWIKCLEKIGTLMLQPRKDNLSVPMNTFIDLTIRNIVSTLMDLKHLAEVADPQEGKHNLAHHFERTRSHILMETLKEAISVLEKTKHAFKSKDLGQLRKKLEGVIQMSEMKK